MKEDWLDKITTEWLGGVLDEPCREWVSFIGAFLMPFWFLREIFSQERRYRHRIDFEGLNEKSTK